MAWHTQQAQQFLNQYGQQQTQPSVSMWQAQPEVDMTVAVPHTGVTSMAWAMNFRGLQLPPRVKFITLSGQPIDQARNMMVENSAGSHIFMLDSVAAQTPIIVRQKGTDFYQVMPISEINDYLAAGDLGGVEYKTGVGYVTRCPVEGWQVRTSSDRWVDIKAIISHPYKGILKRITTHTGRIDTSPNHSLFHQKWPVDAKDIRVGDWLAMPRLFKGNKIGAHRTGLFIGGEKLAWLYGLFAAEGSVSGNVVSISNTSHVILYRAKDIAANLLGWDTEIYPDKYGVSKFATTSKSLAAHFNQFYDRHRNKRVPSSILNAPLNIQKSFFNGYIQGDGHIDKIGRMSWTTVSPTLAEGLIFLMSRMGMHSYSLHTRLDKPTVTQVQINKGAKEGEVGFDKLKDPREVTKVEDIFYDGTVYDLATENQRFMGGIGGFLCHNSDVLPPLDVIPRLMRHNVDMVTGIYWRREAQPVPGIYKWFPDMITPLGRGGHRAILDFPQNSLFKVDVAGAGCLLIKREVFNKLPKSLIRDFYIKHYGDTPASRDIPSGWFRFGTISQNQMCVLPNHDVLGGSNIQDIKRGEEIYNGHGEKAQVLGTWMRAWNGKVRCIRARGTLPITVTPEHELLVLRGARKRLDYGKSYRIKTRNKKRTLVRLAGKWQAWDFSKAKIGKVPAALIKEGDYLAVPKLKTTNTKEETTFGCFGKTNRHKEAKNHIPLTEDFGWLMGIYFAEGSVAKNHANVQFCFAMKEQNLVDKTAQLMWDIFGLPTTKSVGDHALIVQVSCSYFAKWMHERFGANAQEKQVPQIILENSKLWKSFIKGVWDGDGYQTYNGPNKNPALGLNIATKQGSLAIFILLTSLNIRSSIREYTQPAEAFGHGNKIYVIKILTDVETLGELVGRPIKNNRRYSTECSFYYENKLWLRIGKITDQHYDGLVYDLNIPNKHTYILNGIVSGNSEDFAFFNAARMDYGIDLWCDSSVKCQHILPSRVGEQGFQVVDSG